MSQRKFFSVMVMAQHDAIAEERDFSELLDVLLANPLAAIAQMDLQAYEDPWQYGEPDTLARLRASTSSGRARPAGFA